MDVHFSVQDGGKAQSCALQGGSDPSHSRFGSPENHALPYHINTVIINHSHRLLINTVRALLLYENRLLTDTHAKINSRYPPVRSPLTTHRLQTPWLPCESINRPFRCVVARFHSPSPLRTPHITSRRGHLVHGGGERHGVRRVTRRVWGRGRGGEGGCLGSETARGWNTQEGEGDGLTQQET